MGITAIEMAEGLPPKAKMNPIMAMKSVPKDPPPTLADEEKHMPDFVAFVRKCLVKDPKERPSGIDMLMDPFIQGAKGHEVLRNTVTDLLKIKKAKKIQEEEELAKKPPPAPLRNRAPIPPPLSPRAGSRPRPVSSSDGLNLGTFVSNEDEMQLGTFVACGDDGDNNTNFGTMVMNSSPPENDNFGTFVAREDSGMQLGTFVSRDEEPQLGTFVSHERSESPQLGTFVAKESSPSVSPVMLGTFVAKEETPARVDTPAKLDNNSSPRCPQVPARRLNRSDGRVADSGEGSEYGSSVLERNDSSGGSRGSIFDTIFTKEDVSTDDDQSTNLGTFIFRPDDPASFATMRRKKPLERSPLPPPLPPPAPGSKIPLLPIRQPSTSLSSSVVSPNAPPAPARPKLPEDQEGFTLVQARSLISQLRQESATLRKTLAVLKDDFSRIEKQNSALSRALCASPSTLSLSSILNGEDGAEPTPESIDELRDLKAALADLALPQQE
mgnify:CR=1 FL=1